MYAFTSRSPHLIQKLKESSSTDHHDVPEDGPELIPLPPKQPITIQIWRVLKKIYPMTLSIASLYTVTIGLMPAIISGIESVDRDNGSLVTNKYFEGIVVFLLFNFGDLCGRMVCSSVKLFKKGSKWIPILCVARVVFIPLFCLCNLQPRTNLPVVFKSDVFPVLFNTLFSVSNGYFTSTCMVYGTELVEPSLTEMAGNTMQLFLILGSSLGAVVSVILVKII